MAEVNGDLICEMLKRVQADISLTKEGQRDYRQDGLSLRRQIHSMQGDISSLRASVGHVEDHLDRIETRLELREMSEPSQLRLDPAT